MFKRAVFTDEVSQDLQTVVDVSLEYGLDGIEIRSIWDTPPQNLVPQLPKIKETLKNTGLAVCSIASPFFKCDIDSEEEYAQHIGILRNCIRLAQALDCKIIRGFTFWRKGKVEKQWNKIIAQFEEPVQILEAEDMYMAIENEASTSIGTGKVLARFLKEIDSPRIGSMWDPANSLFDEDVEEVPYPDGYETIKDRMIHMHLKDAGKDPETGEMACTPIGEGEIDFQGQFKALTEDGYEGYVSLETHWRPVKLSKEELDRPGGSAFSESGEYASRLCLDNWTGMLRELGLL